MWHTVHILEHRFAIIRAKSGSHGATTREQAICAGSAMVTSSHVTIGGRGRGVTPRKAGAHKDARRRDNSWRVCVWVEMVSTLPFRSIILECFATRVVSPHGSAVCQLYRCYLHFSCPRRLRCERCVPRHLFDDIDAELSSADEIVFMNSPPFQLYRISLVPRQFARRSPGVA